MRKPYLRTTIALSALLIAAAAADARQPKLSKYPLRVHVLAADITQQRQRMSPAESVACDSIDDMVSSISPNPGGPVTLSGISADPCLMHPEVVAGRLLDINQYDPIFSGEGRGDLVSPPASTVGFSFRYDDCARVRVPSGFNSLPARWKKPGQKLEVLVPTDDIPVDGRPLPPARCTFTVTLHDFVYLLLANGKLIQVSQDDYWKKPALRVFLSGAPTTVQERLNQFTVPVSADRSR